MYTWQVVSGFLSFDYHQHNEADVNQWQRCAIKQVLNAYKMRIEQSEEMIIIVISNEN